MTELGIHIVRNCGMLTEISKNGIGLTAYDRDTGKIEEHCGVVGRNGKKVSFIEHFRDLDKISERYGLAKAIEYDLRCTINHIKEMFEFLKLGFYD